MIRALSNLSSKIFSMQLFLGRTSVVWHQAEHYNWASTLQSSTVQSTLSAARQRVLLTQLSTQGYSRKDRVYLTKRRYLIKCDNCFLSTYEGIAGRNHLLSMSTLDSSAVPILTSLKIANELNSDIRISFPKVKAALYWKDCSRWFRSLHHWRSVRTV